MEQFYGRKVEKITELLDSVNDAIRNATYAMNFERNVADSPDELFISRVYQMQDQLAKMARTLSAELEAVQVLADEEGMTDHFNKLSNRRITRK